MNCSQCGGRNATESVRCAKCGADLLGLSGETMADERSLKVPTSSSISEAADSPTDVPTEFVSNEEISSAGAAASSPSGGDAFLTESLELSGTFGDRYEILELLGRGGMGAVYKARDLELDKPIALKVILGEKHRDSEMVKRFKQELLLARQVTHKNVVRIYDLGEAEGIKFFTMELVEGETLKQLIR